MLSGTFQKRSFNRCAVLLGLIALVLFLPSTAKLERLPVKTYTVADGLLRDNVLKIKQDSRGFLWFCTDEGVSRFDGEGFTNFTTDDGLPDRHANDFLETRDGAIYIATDKGLARLNPNGIRGSKDNPLFSVFLTGKPRAEEFSVLFEDTSGEIFSGTGDGLYKFKNDSFEQIALGEPRASEDHLKITSIIKDRRGALWIATEAGGLIHISATGERRRFNHQDGLPNNKITTLHEDKNGRIWAGLRPLGDAGLCLLKSEPIAGESIVEKHYTKKDGLPGDWIFSLHESNDGRFWIGTNEGLCLWQGENSGSVCQTFSAAQDLCDTEFFSLGEDADGNLWLGSRCGLKKLSRFGFSAFGTDDGLPESAILSIFENYAGELFIGSGSIGKRTISRFDGARFQTVEPNLPANITYHGWGWKQTVWQDRENVWWIPTGEGLFRFSPVKNFSDLENASSQEMKIPSKGKEIFRLFEDSRGDIWVATTKEANGLFRWERSANVWHDYTAQAGFSRQRVGTVFAEDRNGNLWIATGEQDSALVRYRDGQFRVFTQAEGAPEGWTKDLFLDTKGRLWLATFQDGLLRLDDTDADQLDFVRYTTADGLASNNILCVTEDQQSRIYAGTGRGLNRLNPETGEIKHFTTADGLPNSYIEVAFRDRMNTLWFGTMGGWARLVPEQERQRQPPTILITGLRVNGQPQPVSILGEREISALDFDSSQRQISVEFLGLGATLGEQLRYEYRFGNSEWTPTTERTVNFANLDSGKYQFEVRAQTAERIYSHAPAVVSFKIAAPVWQRPWFVLSAILIVGAVFYLLYRYRIARLLEVANMRTRIATDLHDDIGANLTKIAILSEVAQHQLEQNTIRREDKLFLSIADISRESVSSMSDIVWAINPKKDSLLDLTRRMRGYAEETLQQCGIRLKFEAPLADSDLKLDANTRRNIYLIFKESLNNIVRHSQASKVEVDLKIAGKELILQIRDNGKGFDTSQEYDGNGLLSIKKRAADAGGSLQINSSDGAGTKIVLRAPIFNLHKLAG
ncbi:MAG: two-component regulator propeller domain-containing protein [Pyrinomonadaceae bacterium]